MYGTIYQRKIRRLSVQLIKMLLSYHVWQQNNDAVAMLALALTRKIGPLGAERIMNKHGYALQGCIWRAHVLVSADMAARARYQQHPV